MDSDSDAPLVQADSDADLNPQVPALTSLQARSQPVWDNSPRVCGVTPNWFHASIQWHGADGERWNFCT